MNSLTKLKHHKITVVDLFAGVGGFSLGFIKSKDLNAEPIFDVQLLVDHDKEAAFTFKKNYPRIPYLIRDMRQVTAKEIKTFVGNSPNIIIGGPPCQGFSSAGKRLFDDERNELVRDFYEIVIELKPLVVLMENVPNLLGNSHGQYGFELIDRLKDAGYSACSGIIQANDYGVPQIRKRAFFFGVNKDVLNDEPLFPVKQQRIISVEDAIGDLPSLISGEGKDPAIYQLQPKSSYQKERRKGSSFIFNHVARKHAAALLEKISIIPEGGGNRDLHPEIKFSDNYFSQAYARLKRDNLAYTITTNFLNPGSGRFMHYRDLRSITVREAARLQGFDDNFIFHGTLTAQARHVGNAVPPLLSLAWANHIAELLGVKKSIKRKYKGR